MSSDIKLDEATAEYIQKSLLNGLPWPPGGNGGPDDAALLGYYPDRVVFDNVMISLRMYGIPAFEQSGDEMPFSKVLFGTSLRGGYIYVPKSVLEDALFLLNNPPEGEAIELDN